MDQRRQMGYYSCDVSADGCLKYLNIQCGLNFGSLSSPKLLFCFLISSILSDEDMMRNRDLLFLLDDLSSVADTGHLEEVEEALW